MNRDVKYIVVHCADTPADMDVGAKEIDLWHKEKGWAMIGYHFVIRRNGNVEKGRPLDDDHLIEPNEVGAHVAGYNSVSIGVCMVGGAKRVVTMVNGVKKKSLIPEDNFNSLQYDSLVEVLTKLHNQFPKARIVGHRDLNAGKACPSFSVRDFLIKYGFDGSVL